MDQFLEEFRRNIEDSKKRLLAMSENQASVSLPGKWSPKQIVGHLIDSAANNHQRFVRASFTTDLVCPGYDQEAWVTLQRYDSESWNDLVKLWAGYNSHLLHVVSVIPREALSRSRTEHNLDRVAFKAVDKSTPTTLEYFVKDYVEHMRHHLRQILGTEI